VNDPHDRLRSFLREAPPESVAAAEDPRPRIGRYTLVRLIARGGMGVVYEAEDPELKRRIALKVLKEGDVGRDVVARLHREAAIAAQLQHPNIVVIHEVGMVRDATGQPTHFIAMDYVEGRTFADVLADATVTRDERLRMLEDVARAVAYAHGKGVVHRDLKPQNVLVDKASRVVLTDFGLARAEGFASHITRSQAVMGTPQYMAPEQVEGRSREIDARTDVYALGVMLYELVAGRPPFRGESVARIYQQILLEEPERLGRAARDVDGDLEVVCMKAMEKERYRRYGGALGFADDLARLRRGESVKARPPSVFYVLRRELKRRRAIVVTAAAVVTLALGVWLAVGTLRTSWRVRDGLARASLREREGDLQEARDQYRGVLNLDDRNAEAQRGFDRVDGVLQRRRREQEARIAEAEARAHRHREAERTLEEVRPILARAPHAREQDVPAMRLDVQRAQEAIEAALERAPDLPSAHYLLGCAWEIRGWDDEAERSWRRALEFDRAYGPARFRLGRLLLVRAFMAKARSIGAAAGLARDAQSELERAMSAEGAFEQPIQREIAATMVAYASGDDAAVERTASAAIERYPNAEGAEELWWLRGAVAPPDRQVEFLTRAVEIRPTFAQAILARAFVHHRRRDFAKAAEDYDRGLRLAPRAAEGYANRGALHAELGRRDLAIADCTEALRIRPDLVEALVNRASARAGANDPKAAIVDASEAIRVNPEVPEAYAIRGSCLFELRDREAAWRDFEEAIRLRPDYADPLFNTGLMLMEQGKTDEAIERFTRAIQADPKHVKAHIFRGDALAAKGDGAGAMRDGTRALELISRDDPLRPRLVQWLDELRKRREKE